MEIYARQGFTDFVLAAGFKMELIEQFARTLPSSWKVDVVDTGVDANTGSRVATCADRMSDPWFLTYADGLGAVDLRALLRFHDGHGGAATMTTVPLPSQYGTVQLGEREQVLEFLEKPRLADHWISAGFFVVEGRASQWFVGPDLERDVLPLLAAAGELFAFRHAGFWRSMDTYKDALELSELCAASEPPWFDPAWATRGDR
jgi:glucose-1-phosphate cytidylyltransferase